MSESTRALVDRASKIAKESETGPAQELAEIVAELGAHVQALEESNKRAADAGRAHGLGGFVG